MQPTVSVFDELAAVYDEVLPFFRGFAARLIAEVAPAPGTRLLDLAAGAGAITGQALARGCVVTAVDAAPAMVARITAEHPHATARVMDIHRLGVPDAVFDVVTVGFAMHLVDDPAAVAAEARRVLTPGGVFAFTVPGPAVGTPDPVDALFAEFARYLPPGGSMGAPLDAMTVLTEAGFTGLTGTLLNVGFPVPDVDTLWRWLNSHGAKAFLDDLPPEQRDRFRMRLHTDLASSEHLLLARTARMYCGYAPY